MYQFPGNVNLFHSRVHDGIASVAGLRVPTPEPDDAEQAPALACVRPHDIGLARMPAADKAALAATVTGLRSARADRAPGAEARRRAVRSRADARALPARSLWREQVRVRPRRMKLLLAPAAANTALTEDFVI